MRRSLIRIGAGIGTLAAIAALSGCSGLLRAGGQQADNPIIREGGEAAAKNIDEFLRAGRSAEEEAAAQGWRVLSSADSLTYTATATSDAGTGTHQLKMKHTEEAADDGLTEDEISQVECYVNTVGQLPDGTEEVMKGESYLQRDDYGGWVESILVNNLKDIITGLELPSVCDVVLSAMPGADE